MKNRLFGVLRRARSVCAPKNAGKRIFAAFLSVCVAVSAFVIPVHAVPAIVPALVELFEQWFIGYAEGVSAQAILQTSSSLNDAQKQSLLNSLSDAASQDLITFYADDDQKTIFVKPAEGLSGERQKMAEFVADSVQKDLSKMLPTGELCSHALYNDLCWSPGHAPQVSTGMYEYLKESAYNSMNAYVVKNAYERTEETAADLENALGESFPRYYFDITDPSKTKLSFKSPESGNMTSLHKDGFYFSLPVDSSYCDTSVNYESESTCQYICSSLPFLEYRQGVSITSGFSFCNSSDVPLYSYCYYALADDGSLYYFGGQYSSSGGTFSSISPTYYYKNPSSVRVLFDKDGNNTGKQLSDLGNVRIGMVFNKSNPGISYPFSVKETLTDDDFWTTTGGETISSLLPFTGAEKILGSAIAAGLISADAPLTIGADGKIAAADGIPIDKLGQILEAIMSGNLNLESIEDYLSLISTLVGNGNLTATEQKKILENIGAYTGAFAGDISEIKDILKEWAKAAEAEAAAENLDFDLPDVTIIDKFPFSLPFDVYYVLDLLCTDPKKPIFTIPIKTTLKVGNFSYKVDKSITLDLTTFKIGGVDMVRAFINSGVTIAFVFALIAGTRKFIWK